MKILKNIYYLFFALLLFSYNITIAQEKLDKYPEPVEGMNAIAKNVHYPETAKKAGVEGTVFVTATINAKGKVVSTKVTQSDNKMLNQAAVDAIKKTNFIAGEKDGKKVKCTVTIPIKFKLDSEKKDKAGKLPEPVDGMQGLMKNVRYPEEAKKAGIEGKVFISALIGKNGEVISAKVLKSDNDLLGASALEAVKATKFIPAEKENEKIESEITIPIMFKLDNKK